MIMSTQQEQAVRAMADSAPKLAELTEQVLFGDIWERLELNKRERSLITVSALIALNRIEQQPFHFERAMQNGISRAELTELITHLAFYSGWPTAASAINVLKSLPDKTPADTHTNATNKE
jgi:4-carboxymuconolactone decarboxylase